MKIVGKRGGAYLVSLERDNRGFMFNPKNLHRSPVMDIDSFIARGYWNEVRKPPYFDLKKILESEPEKFYEDDLD